MNIYRRLESALIRKLDNIIKKLQSMSQDDFNERFSYFLIVTTSVMFGIGSGSWCIGIGTLTACLLHGAVLSIHFRTLR